MAIKAETVIVGDGPCGLSQVFELELHGMRAHLIESLPHLGGKCSGLYFDKPIYDIPAIPLCGAKELINRPLEQVKPFDAEFRLGQQVTVVKKLDDGRSCLKTSVGTEFETGAVVVAGDVGSFEPKPRNIPGIFAVGGINTYSRETKLVLSGFHEAMRTAFAVKAHPEPGKKVNYQYTTTSSVIHQRLGIESPKKKAG